VRYAETQVRLAFQLRIRAAIIQSPSGRSSLRWVRAWTATESVACVAGKRCGWLTAVGTCCSSCWRLQHAMVASERLVSWLRSCYLGFASINRVQTRAVSDTFTELDQEIMMTTIVIPAATLQAAAARMQYRHLSVRAHGQGECTFFEKQQQCHRCSWQHLSKQESRNT
jgi:hypothetical protein